MDDKTVKEEAKRIPYGMMNFVAVREDMDRRQMSRQNVFEYRS